MKYPIQQIYNPIRMTQAKNEFDYMFKVILIGLSGVGKSNILLKYTKDQFSSHWQTTLGVEYAAKTITTSKGTKIKLQIWDTAGQEKYRSLMKTFYKGASAALIVYDVTREDTFLHLDKEMQIMRDFCKNDVITMVVGNKIDLEEERTVAKQRGLDYAKDKKVAFYEVSAKDGTNIDLIFDTIGEEFQKAVSQPVAVATESISSPTKSSSKFRSEKVENIHKDSIVLDNAGEAERVKQGKEKKKCCQ